MILRFGLGDAAGAAVPLLGVALTLFVSLGRGRFWRVSPNGKMSESTGCR